MNRSLDLWKDVPGVCEEVSTTSQSDSSSIGMMYGSIFV